MPALEPTHCSMNFDVTLYDVVSEEQIRKNLKNIFDILVEAGMTTQACR